MRFINTFTKVVSTVFLAVLVFVPNTSAQTSSANAAQGLQISPTRYELNAAKGQTYIMELSVMNVTASDLFYSSSVSDFESADETGSPKIANIDDLSESASIRSWISDLPASFTLKARQTMDLKVKVNVPADAEPGGHYGAVLFSGSTPNVDTTGVGLSASSGLLVLVRVDGDITEQASLAEFFTANGNNQSWFFEQGPVALVTRIKNEGNVHVQPSGSIKITNMFGNVVSTIPINDSNEKSNVLPDSIRRFDSVYDNSFMLGMYTAELALAYGTTGQAITGTISFWVIPYKIVLAVLVAVITLVFIFRTMIRVYNKRITEKIKNEIANKDKKHSKKKD